MKNKQIKQLKIIQVNKKYWQKKAVLIKLKDITQVRTFPINPGENSEFCYFVKKKLLGSEVDDLFCGHALWITGCNLKLNVGQKMIKCIHMYWLRKYFKTVILPINIHFNGIILLSSGVPLSPTLLF